MSSNVILFLGPVLGLLAARLFGPWRPVSALMSSILGELILFGAYNAWQKQRVAQLLASPPRAGSHRDVLIAMNAHPSIRGQLMALGVLVVIAAVVTALFLGAQLAVSRSGGGRPTAG